MYKEYTFGHKTMRNQELGSGTINFTKENDNILHTGETGNRKKVITSQTDECTKQDENETEATTSYAGYPVI